MDFTIYCHLCNQEIPYSDAEDYYCPGCREYICEKCSKNFLLMGRHEAEDHLIEIEEE